MRKENRKSFVDPQPEFPEPEKSDIFMPLIIFIVFIIISKDSISAGFIKGRRSSKMSAGEWMSRLFITSDGDLPSEPLNSRSVF